MGDAKPCLCFHALCCDSGQSITSAPCALFCLVLLTVSEVIELSSGEEDTLHIVDSSESVSEEDEEEEKGGTHVNDVLNQRDALGRVLVNLNHPPEEENVFLAPQLARAVKPHQVRQTLALFSVPVGFLLWTLPASARWHHSL